MRRVLAVLFAGAGIASTALAGPFSVGPQAGFTFGGDVEEPAVAFGAQGTWAMNDAWSLELAVYRFTDETEESERWAGGGAIWQNDIDVMPIALTVRFAFPVADKLRLHVGAGASYVILDSDSSATPIPGTGTTQVSLELDPDNGFGLHGVAGASYDLCNRCSLFAEALYGVVAYDYEAAYAGVDGGWAWAQTEDDNDSYTYGMLRLGANIRF